MNETQFKILMYKGLYVDENLLHTGIYGTTKPILHHKDETIETLETRRGLMKDKLGKSFLSEIYFSNLKQCELVNASIIGQI